MILDELYQDLILDHYKNPRCKGCLANADSQCELRNPLCGDSIEVTVKVKEGLVQEIAFQGHGCSISQAGASMMTELCKGKTVSEVRELCKVFRGMMRGDKSKEEIHVLGDAVSLEGVRKFSARIKCALLAWDVIERCMDQLEGKNSPAHQACGSA